MWPTPLSSYFKKWPWEPPRPPPAFPPRLRALGRAPQTAVWHTRSVLSAADVLVVEGDAGSQRGLPSPWPGTLAASAHPAGQPHVTFSHSGVLPPAPGELPGIAGGNRGRRTAPRTVSGLVPRRQARPSQKPWVDALLQSGLLCTLAYIIGVIRVLSLVVCTPQQTAVSIREGLSRKKLVYPQNRTNGNGPGG